MTARFLALYDPPADPEAFDRHYDEIHIPLIRQLPGLRRYSVAVTWQPSTACPATSLPSWNGRPWRSCARRSARPRAKPPQPMRRTSRNLLRYAG